MSVEWCNDSVVPSLSGIGVASPGHGRELPRQACGLDKTTILLQTSIGVSKIDLGQGRPPIYIASSKEVGTRERRFNTPVTVDHGGGLLGRTRNLTPKINKSLTKFQK